VREAAEGCVRAGIPNIGLWRDKVIETGLAESAKIVRELGLQISSLCRGGMFPADSAAERQARIDDNRRAIDEAVALGTGTLVLVCGGLPAGSRDIAAARAMVEDGIAAIIPYAAECGIKLGIEPLHPMFAADRSVINTLGQANDIVERLKSPQVGVVIDVYHVWWDPDLYREINRAAGHTWAFHISDWLVPTPDILLGRGLPGDGVIDIRRIRAAVEAAGYKGLIEVEVFNRTVWDAPGDEVLARMCKGYLEHA
jgi:sugar phosphate isomerase/epimerase